MANDKLILWKPLYKTTVVLYILVFILAFPAPKIATLLLFAIIAIWSRVPALMTQFTKDVEVVDFTTVTITIYFGPLVGCIFGSGIIAFTRLFGPTEPMDYTVRDTICFFIGAFVVALVYKLTGGHIMITMFSMTFIRYTVYPILGLFFNPGALVLDIVILSISLPIAIVSNVLLVKIFGDSFDKIFAHGASLNWGLFAFVTLIIAVIFVISKFMDKEEEKRLALEPETPKEQQQLDLGIIGTLAHAPEPHESLFILVDIQDIPDLLRATKKLFNGFLVALFFLLIALTQYQAGFKLAWWQYTILALGLYFLIDLTYKVLYKYLVKTKRQFAHNRM